MDRFFRCGLSLLVGVLWVEVINEFFGLLVLGIGQFEFEFALLGAQHDRLAFHAADHVEGSLGLATKGHLQNVFLDAGGDGLAQLGLDLKEAVGRAKAFDALMRPLVVVIFGPEFNALPGLLETVKLGAGQKLLPESLPEAFDFAERHRVLRTALDVDDAVLFQFGFEAGSAAPGGVLATIVSKHLLGRLILADGHAVDFDSGRRGGAAEQIQANQVTGIIIEEGDQVGIATAESEGEDVALPELIGSGPLKETRTSEVALFGWWSRRHQLRLMESLAHRLRTGFEEEPAAQQLGDAFDARGGLLLFEFEDFIAHRSRQLGMSGGRAGLEILQTVRTQLAVALDPAGDGLRVDGQFLGDQLAAEPFLQVELDGAQFERRRIPALGGTGAARKPPRGFGVLLLLFYRLIILHGDTSLSLKCQPFSRLTRSHDLVAKTTLFGNTWSDAR